MRSLLQRVSRAAVRVDHQVVGSIERGLLVLVGLENGDGPAQIDKTARKIASLRLFEDGEGRMNLDLSAVGGAVLLVSQFTLAGSLARGRRPSFSNALDPHLAEPLIERLAQSLRELGVPVETGRFGAQMAVELVNDGPVTFVFDA